jgi:protein tyrosine/serine phosphatase
MQRRARCALHAAGTLALLSATGCLSPKSWSVVDAGALLRSGQPDLEELQSIHAQTGLKTIVRLRNFHEADQQMRSFARQHGINVIDIPIDRGDTPSRADVQRFLRLFADKSNLPVLVHCAHGTERTGVMVALYRCYFNQWSPDQAVREMKAMGFDALFHPKLERYVRSLESSFVAQ